MVYSPSTYLVSAAVATVALQMQQASAASLFYEPITVSDKDCAIEVEADPTLPDIATIPTEPVTFTDLLANTSAAPLYPLFTKMGAKIMLGENSLVLSQ
ncbi:hypothetical protein PC129_g16217 [Phytophthora cactorum]|uniref:Uncharacterized protein n=1 Tax=Phytophthora cactorum TaxID=29920 RepID=A0A8T1BA12_9STRA|nr:hypothetical protein PC112_g8588 [Phytophthora cactorum]KAG2884025.1 hypothetical protein PC114_g20318 [Phytophthora cactorum]KAG2897382.1 hypothetical protein PC115_g17208 [Phytophthora cactorum]KAG2986114.1 hypothetical protein PC119_g20009 [Phytophthora cactorum]KAG3137903.1 hypothetical protein C6341_g20831 [Phytophthora cactorum]